MIFLSSFLTHLHFQLFYFYIRCFDRKNNHHWITWRNRSPFFSTTLRVSFYSLMVCIVEITQLIRYYNCTSFANLERGSSAEKNWRFKKKISYTSTSSLSYDARCVEDVREKDHNFRSDIHRNKNNNNNNRDGTGTLHTRRNPFLLRS